MNAFTHLHAVLVRCPLLLPGAGPWRRRWPTRGCGLVPVLAKPAEAVAELAESPASFGVVCLRVRLGEARSAEVAATDALQLRVGDQS
jgi:hypothetical protein